MPQHPEAIIEDKKRPFTGAEFLESLRDGREVYIYGDRVQGRHRRIRRSATRRPPSRSSTTPCTRRNRRPC